MRSNSRCNWLALHTQPLNVVCGSRPHLNKRSYAESDRRAPATAAIVTPAATAITNTINPRLADRSLRS
jgi:hypothetical protein